MQPGGPDGEARDLLAAETSARDAVVLTRMRLMNAWREADAIGGAPGESADAPITAAGS
jgi:hypothetical protein